MAVRAETFVQFSFEKNQLFAVLNLLQQPKTITICSYTLKNFRKKKRVQFFGFSEPATKENQ